ncbi:MAG: hypothetical protein CBC46_09140 [Verrucomicrobiaceae bacterium TMED86]|nr:MAG: hypothetical protein CBC46_09140 [Verrucomicrobiaceae bacterium TMED86]
MGPLYALISEIQADFASESPANYLHARGPGRAHPHPRALISDTSQDRSAKELHIPLLHQFLKPFLTHDSLQTRIFVFLGIERL